MGLEPVQPGAPAGVVSDEPAVALQVHPAVREVGTRHAVAVQDVAVDHPAGGALLDVEVLSGDGVDPVRGDHVAVGTVHADAGAGRVPVGLGAADVDALTEPGRRPAAVVKVRAPYAVHGGAGSYVH